MKECELCGNEAVFRDQYPDGSGGYDWMRGKVVNLLTQALQDGMEYLDLVQILAVVHGLPVTNKDIKRWVSST